MNYKVHYKIGGGRFKEVNYVGMDDHYQVVVRGDSSNTSSGPSKRHSLVSFDDENALRNVSLGDLLSALEHAFMNKDSISRPYNPKEILSYVHPSLLKHPYMAHNFI